MITELTKLQESNKALKKLLWLAIRIIKIPEHYAEHQKLRAILVKELLDNTKHLKED